VSWIAILHSIGLTNLSDADVARYEALKRVNGPKTIFHTAASNHSNVDAESQETDVDMTPSSRTVQMPTALCYGAKEFAAAFRTVRNNTIKIAEEIPESNFDFRPAPDVRSVGQTLTHIAISTGFQTHVHANKITDLEALNFVELFQQFAAEETKRRTKGEIIALLRSEGDKFAAFLESLSDSFLVELVDMPSGADPSRKTRFEMLLSAKEHEIHHRGQLMTMQRMLGLVPHLTRQIQERLAATRSPAETRS
jgi:uncharacterized damage-inducible protein DinB